MAEGFQGATDMQLLAALRTMEHERPRDAESIDIARAEFKGRMAERPGCLERAAAALAVADRARRRRRVRT